MSRLALDKQTLADIYDAMYRFKASNSFPAYDKPKQFTAAFDALGKQALGRQPLTTWTAMEALDAMTRVLSKEFLNWPEKADFVKARNALHGAFVAAGLLRA